MKHVKCGWPCAEIARMCIRYWANANRLIRGMRQRSKQSKHQRGRELRFDDKYNRAQLTIFGTEGQSSQGTTVQAQEAPYTPPLHHQAWPQTLPACAQVPSLRQQTGPRHLPPALPAPQTDDELRCLGSKHRSAGTTGPCRRAPQSPFHGRCAGAARS